jgi:hypothetical protein
MPLTNAHLGVLYLHAKNPPPPTIDKHSFLSLIQNISLNYQKIFSLSSVYEMRLL